MWNTSNLIQVVGRTYHGENPTIHDCGPTITKMISSALKVARDDDQTIIIPDQVTRDLFPQYDNDTNRDEHGNGCDTFGREEIELIMEWVHIEEISYQPGDRFYLEQFDRTIHINGRGWPHWDRCQVVTN